MAQDLTVNIKTTSDVPQAMDRAKGATDSFGKQVEGISKKFAGSFKDIFLSFLGPMALITGAFALISKLIDDNRRKREEANQAAIDNTNQLISAEDTYYARKMDREKKAKETVEQAATAREEVTLSFLQNDPRGKSIVDQSKAALPPGMSGAASFNAANNLAREKKIQDEVQKLISEDLAKNGMIAKPGEEGPKGSTSFKGPEGFSNVVGVGANPVMEAMNAQLEEQRKQTALLQQIASPNGSVPSDFTKSTSPSRAALLRGAL